MPPTEDQLRDLAQKIGNETVIGRLEEILLEKGDPITLGRYYLHGVLTVHVKDTPLSQEQIDEYFRIIDLPKGESARLLKNKLS